jgi:hypothetical protein
MPSANTQDRRRVLRNSASGFFRNGVKSGFRLRAVETTPSRGLPPRLARPGLYTGTPAAHAAKNATHVIPIVTVTAGDPIGTGLVTSLARPGGNVTGLTDHAADVVAKRLELIKEVIPSATRVAVLLNPDNSSNLPQLRLTQKAAPALAPVSWDVWRTRSAVDVATVTDLEDGKSEVVVLDLVQDAVIPWPDPKHIVARELLAARWPGLIGQPLHTRYDAPPVLRGKPFEFLGRRWFDQQPIACHDAVGLSVPSQDRGWVLWTGSDTLQDPRRPLPDSDGRPH